MQAWIQRHSNTKQSVRAILRENLLLLIRCKHLGDNLGFPS